MTIHMGSSSRTPNPLGTQSVTHERVNEFLLQKLEVAISTHLLMNGLNGLRFTQTRGSNFDPFIYERVE